MNHDVQAGFKKGRGTRSNCQYLLDHWKTKGVPEKHLLWLSDFTFTFHFHALKKETATHSSVLAWRIPGTGEPGGLTSMGSHRVGHNWSDLAAAAAAYGNFEHYFASMWNECNCAVVWTFFGIALLWDWNENWPFPVLWPLWSFPNLLAYWVQHFHSNMHLLGALSVSATGEVQMSLLTVP